MTPIGTIHTLSDYRSKAVFQSRADGEHALCRSCQRAGYGEDSWHPCLPDFWPKQDGKLRFDTCRACKSERTARRYGLVTLEVTTMEMEGGAQLIADIRDRVQGFVSPKRANEA